MVQLLVNSVEALRFIDFWGNGRNLTVILEYIERRLFVLGATRRPGILIGQKPGVIMGTRQESWRGLKLALITRPESAMRLLT